MRASIALLAVPVLLLGAGTTRAAQGQGAADVDTSSNELGATSDVELAKQFSILDEDGDGLISRVEARVSEDLARDFDTIDRNQDGFLDKKEFATGLRARNRSQTRAGPDRSDNTPESEDGGGAGGFLRNLFGGGEERDGSGDDDR